jgi:hypothetical protein
VDTETAGLSACRLRPSSFDVHREHWAGWEGETEVRQIFG